VHRQPEVPFYFRGELMEPKDIRRLDGMRLHFVLVREAAETRLAAYEFYRDVAYLLRQQDLVALIRAEAYATYAQGSAGLAPGHPPEPGGGGVHAEVVRVDPGSGGLMSCEDNDERPSREAQFFDHIDFKGDWFWVGPGGAEADLTKMTKGKFLFWDDGDW